MQDGVVLEAKGIAKAFGAVQALQGVDLTVRRGVVHALLGENGAGKSTLVKILGGVVRPDQGTILVNGKRYAPHSPDDAVKAGIAVVFQELSLIPDLSVAQNIVLGQEPRRGGVIIDRAASRRRAHDILTSMGFPLPDLDVPVRELPLSTRQIIEIARAVAHQPQILILDEATSALNIEQTQRLFAFLRRLRETGVAILFITHRMSEVAEIADEITVLRDGQTVGHLTRDTFDVQHVVELMAGESSAALARHVVPQATTEDVLLRVDALKDERVLRGVSFELRRGEILGVAGLEGQGQSELFLALYGAHRLTSGSMTLAGHPYRPLNPWSAVHRGVAFIPGDRRNLGLIPRMSVRANTTFPILSRFSRLGLLNLRQEEAVVRQLIAQLRIKTPSPDTVVDLLSGGTQQKVCFARGLATEPVLYLMYDPTRGIDVGTKAEIYRLVEDLAGAGAGVLFFSTDLDELLSLSHRLIVLYEGRVTGTLVARDVTPQDVLALAFGMDRQRESAA